MVVFSESALLDALITRQAGLQDVNHPPRGGLALARLARSGSAASNRRSNGGQEGSWVEG